jgi:hypothetical protein
MKKKRPNITTKYIYKKNPMTKYVVQSHTFEVLT